MRRAFRLPSARLLGTAPAALAFAFVIGTALAPASGADAASDAPVFDGARALALVADLVERGQRHYGAPGRGEAIDHLVSLLEPHADRVDLQSFSRREVASGVDYRLTNVIARRNLSARPRILLGSHFDTRLWAEEDPDPTRRDQPIPGANDGTSGVAVLVELLRVVAGTPGLRELGIDVVLFDGEEFGRPGNDEYCQGSKEYAAAMAVTPREAWPSAVIILDMVGDRDLRIRREASSDAPLSRGLSALLVKHGRRMSPDAFVDRPIGPIVDDQTAFQRAGIPSVLLIDLDYPHWHTHQDTVDKLSAESLGVVGHTLVTALPSIVRFAEHAASTRPPAPSKNGPNRSKGPAR